MKYKAKLKYAFLSVFLLAGMFATASAQDTQKKEDEIVPITRQGSAAMMFSMSGAMNFGLYGPSANGSADPRVLAGAGFKYYFNDRWAGRVLLNFGTATSGPDSAETKSSLYGIGLTAEWHCHDLYAISPYLGAGIGINVGSITRPITETPGLTGKNGVSPTATNGTTIQTSTTGIAFSLLGGFDWFFTKSMALGAEMSLGYANISSSTTSGGTTVNNPSTSLLGISTVSNVHLIVYF